MAIGLGGGGALAISLETVPGTYQDPSTAGTVWVPILSEGLKYTEDKYYSPQLRQETIVSDVKQSYYHAEGDVVMEVDTQFLPYFLHASRHDVTKTGSGPYQYKYVPNQSATSDQTASITVIRNEIGFGYGGCVMGSFEFMIENGVLRVTMNVLGQSEEEPADLDTASWVAPKLLGADAHSVYVAASAVTPTFSGNDVNHNGFTFMANYNATAQNRIVPDRAATYIAFGETEASYNTELDFVSRTEYNNFVAATQRAVKLESIGDAVSFATSADAVRLQANRSAYDTYDLGLEGIGDIVMARGVTGRIIGIAGGDPFEIIVKSTANIT